MINQATVYLVDWLSLDAISIMLSNHMIGLKPLDNVFLVSVNSLGLLTRRIL